MHWVGLLFKVLEFTLGPMGRASRLALPLVLLDGQGYCQYVSTLERAFLGYHLIPPLPAFDSLEQLWSEGCRNKSSMTGHAASGSAGTYVSRMDAELSRVRIAMSCRLGPHPDFLEGQDCKPENHVLAARTLRANSRILSFGRSFRN